ncbi:MAG: FtsK/SpoIIIE domain-containing protein [Patescibacteria group bacterium]|nr:FtsK/SpoIIIE domain-containing protein [Patescibacteria group bacterium]MDD4304515.1 FtsK/SpoIIIE domain-containing protein [Patescibacteria group bacterium]MDD4694875.1 FtsK/SpoIIIE domain-containing protein [Patescibacteria group bacterium]
MPNIDINIKRNDPNARVPLEPFLDELIKSPSDKFIIPLGRDKDNKLHSIDLKECHHILSAGMALSGVGMFNRVALLSLIKQKDPKDLRIILIDPIRKFQNFYDIPHLLYPPIYYKDRQDTVLNTLKWSIAEMERRYEILAENNVHDMYSYNEKCNQTVLPNIIIFISELGEIIPNEEIEMVLVKILQMAKLIGIHLIISTQWITNKVITNLIKNNISSKLIFQVPSQNEADLLEAPGAEKLIGQGDMIFYGSSDQVLKLQGFHISDEKIEELLKIYK